MRKSAILTFLLIVQLMSFGQRTTYNWFFGDSVGLSFLTSPPTFVGGSSMNTAEGCSSISDSLGNLLFYTDGQTVWNRNHDTLANGNELCGPYIISRNSSTQAALIVKKPGSGNQYYVFSTPEDGSTSNTWASYSIVDMDEASGNGKVIEKTRQFMNSTSEKIAAVRHGNGKDVWIALCQTANKINVYKLTENGITSAVSNVTGFSSSNVNLLGQMKFSVDGKYLAFTNVSSNNNGSVYVFSFNDLTGNLSAIGYINKTGCYGLEFSPDSKLIYLTNNYQSGSFLKSMILQCPVSKIRQQIGMDTTCEIIDSVNHVASALQLGPDAKIYGSRLYLNKLFVIDRPDVKGKGCNFELNGVDLKTGRSIFGLPNFISSDLLEPFIEVSSGCINEIYSFCLKNNRYDSLRWVFHDQQKVRYNVDTISKYYNVSGVQKVSVYAYESGDVDSFFTEFTVDSMVLPNWKAAFVLCEGDSFKLNAYHSSVKQYMWSNGSHDSIIFVKDTGTFALKLSNEYCRYEAFAKVVYGKKALVYLGNDTAFCNSFSHVLDAGKQFASYLWNTGDTVYSIVVDKKGLYNVKAIDSNHCASADTIHLDQFTKPDIFLKADSVSCQGMWLAVDSFPGFEYTWSTGSKGHFTKVLKKGKYHLNTSNAFCSYTDSIQVDVLSSSEPDLGPDTVVCGSLILNVNTGGKYLWNTGEQSESIQIFKPGKYWVKVEVNQCETVDTIEVKECEEMVIYIPNAFSPNGNSKNDVFSIKGKNILWIEMKIFNRWGEEIYHDAGNDPKWDGSYKGETCSDGLYLYVLTIRSNNYKTEFINGVLTLIK